MTKELGAETKGFAISKFCIALIAMAAMLLSGCRSYKDAKLNYDVEKYKQECFGSISNSCRAKLANTNIAVLERILSNIHSDRDGYVKVIGAENYDAFKQVADEVVSAEIARQKTLIPPWYMRVFFGNAENRNGNYLFGEEENNELQEIILRKLKSTKQGGRASIPSGLDGVASSDSLPTEGSSAAVQEAQQSGGIVTKEAAPSPQTLPAANQPVSIDDIEEDPDAGETEDITIPIGGTQVNLKRLDNGSYDVIYNNRRQGNIEGEGVSKVWESKIQDSDAAVVQVISGGTACPAEYAVIEIHSNQSVRVSPLFGTCSDILKGVSTDRNGMIITVQGFKGQFDTSASTPRDKSYRWERNNIREMN